MADPKRAKRITKGKMRLVPKSKWELPLRSSKSYWNKISEGIESKVIRVRNSSTSSPTLYPGAPFSIRSSASSASSDNINLYDFTKGPLASELVYASAPEPIVKIYPPSPPTRDSTTGDTAELKNAIKFQSNHAEKFIDRAESLENSWRIMKLSKMTKLVNDFLSSSRTRVRPNLASDSRKTEQDETQNARLMTNKSFEDQSKDRASYESSIGTMTTQELRKETTDDIEGTHYEKRSVIFRDDIESTVERFDAVEDIANAKPRRPRAPSLSVASAVPSFGRVIISIESISSMEDEVEEGKTKNSEDRLNFISKDHSKSSESRLKRNGEQVTKDFLKVPEIRTNASSSYPVDSRSTYQQQNTLNKIQAQLAQTDKAFKSKLLMETKVLRKKDSFWPRRSIVHVFRALKAMKHGARSKARIESETNQFFAAPLDIYSPSARSSISSDDRIDLIESELERNDEDTEQNGLEETVDVESESSYASVRERLMRNAVSHIGKDFQRATCRIDEDNAPEATSGPADSSVFYNSRNSAGDELKVKPRNKKTSAAAGFIDVPRVARIFPRIKADKCLACMCQSLEGIHQNTRQQAICNFLNEDDEAFLSKETHSELPVFQCSNEESFDQSSKLPVFDENLVKTFSDEDHHYQDLNYNFVDKKEESTTAEVSSAPDSESPVNLLKRSPSQLDASHQSHTIGKYLPTALVTAKLVLSSLSMASERSKSISDHDDSDQGCIDLGENNTGLGTNATSKFLAPCHMAINLKPSLEPLKALRQKKSRSIRSRIASAEKSAGSASDDEDDSDNDENNHRLSVNPTKINSAGHEATMKIDIYGSAGRNTEQAIDAKQNIEADESQSINKSEETQDAMEELSSKSDINDAERTESLTKRFNDEPIISDREVIKIATRCLGENKTVSETLQVLAKEYCNRLSIYSDNNDSLNLSNVRKNEKIAKNLLTLLVDSKSYLNRGKLPNDITHRSFSSKQPPLCNSRQLRRVLPLKSYNLVAPILGMAKWYPKRRTSAILASSKVVTRHKESSDKDFDLIVYPPSRAAHKVSFEEDEDNARPKLSPYALFLTKPRRKAVTWRPLTERDLEGYDPEATLKMRAAKITDRICEEFCQWLNSLAAGTNQTSGIDVDVLKDMFETDFTAEVCSTMQVSINEMTMVPDAVAAARNCPNAGELALTRRHLVEDAKAETKPKRTVGFGTALPDHLKFLPPRNGVDQKWLQCKNVPTDLETMDAVWKDITHLTSVKGFVDWIKAHPRVSRPKALEKVLASKETLVTRQSQEVDGFKDFELDLDNIQSLKVGENDPHAL